MLIFDCHLQTGLVPDCSSARWNLHVHACCVPAPSGSQKARCKGHANAAEAEMNSGSYDVFVDSKSRQVALALLGGRWKFSMMRSCRKLPSFKNVQVAANWSHRCGTPAINTVIFLQRIVHHLVAF